MSEDRKKKLFLLGEIHIYSNTLNLLSSSTLWLFSSSVYNV